MIPKGQKLDDFIAKYDLNRTNGTSLVTRNDLRELESDGFSVENLLNHLCENYHSLLYGSITEQNILKNKKIYASNQAAIEIVKSIFIPEKLKYPGLKFSSEKQLIIEIFGINKNAINQKGYVFIINNTKGFNSKNSYEYLSLSKTVEINAKIETTIKDIIYPVYNVIGPLKIRINDFSEYLN